MIQTCRFLCCHAPKLQIFLQYLLPPALLLPELRYICRDGWDSTCRHPSLSAVHKSPGTLIQMHLVDHRGARIGLRSAELFHIQSMQSSSGGRSDQTLSSPSLLKEFSVHTNCTFHCWGWKKLIYFPAYLKYGRKIIHSPDELESISWKFLAGFLLPMQVLQDSGR